MNFRRLTFFALPVAAAAALGAAVLLHVPDTRADDDQAKARALSRSGQILSLEKIAGQAQVARAGKLIDIDLEQKRGVWIYEVEMLDDQGRVWELKLDARTGEVLEMEQED